MTHEQYNNYLIDYARHHDLYRHIHFNTSVSKLERSTNPPGWIVHYVKGGQKLEKHFTFIAVATGAFRYQKIPNIPGLNDFTGLVIQSNQIRDNKGVFADKKVMIIGGSVTGADLACSALKNQCQKVYLSASSRPNERNRWFMDRYPNGVPEVNPSTIPWDMHVSRAVHVHCEASFFTTFLQGHLMPFVQRRESKTIEPKDAWMIADTLTIKHNLEAGTLEHIDVVTEIISNKIQLVDGRIIDDVDTLVIATGFSKKFPFLDHIWPTSEQTKFELYQHAIPLPETLDGIAFIGMTSAPIGVFVVAEMQARWMARMWKIETYNSQNRLFSIEKRMVMTEHVRYHKAQSTVFNFIPDPFQYLDTLASFLGCLPLASATDFSEAIQLAKDKKDIILAVAVWHGPFISSHYRLNTDDPKVKQRAEDTVISVTQKYMGERFDKLVEYYYDGRFGNEQ
jgi:cation diffusion facilitator CzcD-associated flavoprotein CzcO